MQNLIATWSALDLRRRIVVSLGALAMFASIALIAQMATAPRMALLYAGLDPAAAGDVVAALEQRGVAHQVRGSAIYVDESQRDTLRLTLASEGLPAAGAAGYELLDSLTGFGTTSQMFDAAYWRAKEGELARTILAMPDIRAARVHISRLDPQPLRRPDRQTASVTVTTASGMLSQLKAQALKHLVASAVAGMTPADVAVIDSAGGLIAEEQESTQGGRSAEGRAAEMQHGVERLLEARVGPGRAVVQVSLDIETSSEQITERRFDPQGRVAISTDTEEKSGSSTDPGGQVTVASNLPEGDATAGASGQSSSTESRERVNFEVSETQREVVRAPGEIRRISVAVLVDQAQQVAVDGTVTREDRPQEELDALRELVASAVGLDETRGDTITLRSMSFEPIASEGALVEANMLGGFDPLSILPMLLLSLVVLVLGLFVVRPMVLGQRRIAALPGPGQLFPLDGPQRQPDGQPMGPGRILTGEIADGLDLPPLSVVSREVGPPLPADPVARLRRLIEERQAESVEILRGWMEDREEKT